MDTQRIVLLVIFTFSLFLLNDAWQKQHQSTASSTASTRAGESSPVGGVKPQEVPTPSAGATSPGAPPTALVSESLATGEKIEVVTDVIKAEISSVGGDLRSLELLKQADTEDLKKPFQLLGAVSGRQYIAQSGLIGEGLPNHKSVWIPRAKSYRLGAESDVLEVKLDSASGGVKVTKTYRFRRGSYLVGLDHEIVADDAVAAKPTPHLYFQFIRDGQAPEGASKLAPTFTGVGIFTEQDKFRKVTFEDIAKGKVNYLRNAKDGWIAIIQHYFLSAWLPPAGVPREFYTKRLAEDLYAAGLIIPSGALQAGTPLTVTVQLYSGPQDQDRLQELAAKTAPGIDLAVDYGWLTIIAYPLFWVLSWLHKLVGNWGVAIILLTILIKLAFYPLSAASYRSMAKMKVLGPKLQRLKEQYGDDRQRLHQAMMDLYKTEKINPLGGCLPVAVQIPVFIALYWVLLSSIELRHAPFILWIHDLSKPDPYYILPILMGLSMILQSRLSPTPPDPIQARMMQIMPIVFSVFFFFFPAGLVLYWLVNNIISITQQWYITRGLENKVPAKA